MPETEETETEKHRVSLLVDHHMLEMGKIFYLTDGEVRIAMEIEEGNQMVVNGIAMHPLYIQFVLIL